MPTYPISETEGAIRGQEQSRADVCYRYKIIDETSIDQAIHLAQTASSQVGLMGVDASRFCMAVSEAVSNAVRYAGQGDVYIGRTPNRLGVEAIIRDNGPGIRSIDTAMQDGYTQTPTSLGIGIGAMKRAVEFFRIESAPGLGTTILLRAYPPAKIPIEIGAVCLADRDYHVNGDMYFYHEREGNSLLVGVVDGQGEGLRAHEFAAIATKAITEDYTLDLHEMVHRADAALLQHDEAAATIALALITPDEIQAVVVGDCVVRVLGANGAKPLTVEGMRGCIGLRGMAKIRSQTCARDSGQSMVVLQTDGVVDRWQPDELDLRMSPQTIAEYLMLKYRRQYGDSTVVVVKG